MDNSSIDAVEAQDTVPSHTLRRELGLMDLVPMQILLVVGITWAGIAAKQGGTHVFFWLAAILFLFVPLAAVVGWCAKIWPLEGGVYQWTRHVFGPFAGFMSGWNFALWAVVAISSVGIVTVTSLSYVLGPSADWMQNSHLLIGSLTVGLFLIILVVCIPGFGIGRWVSHFGTAVTVLVTVLLMVLLFIHPHASALHPHVNPQSPFSLGIPAFTLVSINLFSKIACSGLSGLEQVAVFAGETRDPGRTIMRSAWIAAPIIAAIYILMSGSVLAYIPAKDVNLAGPVPQVLAAAFSGGTSAPGTIDWGLKLGQATILLLAVALVAQFAVIVAETSRLPMVAGWDHMVPEWFTRLDPRWRTPTRSIAVIVFVSIAFGLLSLIGTGAQEAFQILSSAGNLLYGVYYVLMFAIPIFASRRVGIRAGFWLKTAGISGLTVTLLSMFFALLPIVDVANRYLFAAKVGGAALAMNVIGAGLYWQGSRLKR